MDNQDYESNENVPSQTSQEDVTFESEKGDIQGKGKTDKKGLDILLKRKGIILILVVLIAFFGIMIVSVVLEGSDVHDYLYYKNGKDLLSKKVTVHYRKFGEENETTSQMDLEEYVSKAVYAYSQDIKKIEEKNENRHDYHLYWALAIALRNEALTNNYTVTYHDDKDIFANYEKDAQIDYALDLAKNLVIVNLKDELISTHVSNYCWSKIHETEPVHVLFHNDLFIPNDFSNEYITNRVYNECECNKSSGIIESSEPFDDEDPQCWIYFEEEISTETQNEDGTTDTDTEIIYKKEYLHQEEQTGFNLSAAYYYWHDLQYNFLQILTIFYGNDININTLNDKNNLEDETQSSVLGGTCDSSGEVPYNASTLTKTEFSQRVEEFFASGKYADYSKLFVQYAGEVYDMGVAKGINPELIYIFARKETAFTGRNGGDVDHYNYYGLGHGNTASHGTYYNSFMEGVEALYNYFISKKSLEGFRDYSYIGDYWYNPGSSGLGGCYYYPYLQKDLGIEDSYIAEACSSSHSGCSKSSHGNCVKTREQDQDYYFSWQKLQYAKHRKAIFGLDATNCYNGSTVPSTDVPSQMLKEPLSEYLASKNSSVTDLNNTILANVTKAGVGTREGVAQAAITLINYMSQYGVRLPYTYGGGHYGNINGPRKNSTSYYGVDPEWGTSIGSYKDSGTGYGPYTHFGPDCSAFVSWVLHNGGIKFSVGDSVSFKSLGTNHTMDGSYVGKIGDPVVSPGHVQIIVGVNTEEKYYVLAESAGLGSSYIPDTKGISYIKVSFNSPKHTIVDFEEYYTDASKHYTNDDFESVFKAGMLS